MDTLRFLSTDNVMTVLKALLLDKISKHKNINIHREIL